jgi:hypothetical protein
MRKPCFFFVLSCVVLLLLVAPQSRADGDASFSFSESTGGTDYLLNWQLPSSDTSVIPSSGVDFLVSNVPVYIYADGVLQDPDPSAFLDTLIFFNSNSGSPADFADLLGFSLGGVGQLYTGPESAPTFVPGSFSGIDPLSQSTASLVVATPEPSSLLLLFIAFLTLAGTMVVRKVPV